MLLLALLALTVLAAARWPVIGFGALWFWIALVPPVGVNLLPVPSAIMAERFLYPPSTLGASLLTGLALVRLVGRVERGGRAGCRRRAPLLPRWCCSPCPW